MGKFIWWIAIFTAGAAADTPQLLTVLKPAVAAVVDGTVGIAAAAHPLLPALPR